MRWRLHLKTSSPKCTGVSHSNLLCTFDTLISEYWITCSNCYCIKYNANRNRSWIRYILTHLLNAYKVPGTHNCFWNDSCDISNIFLKHCICSMNKFYLSNLSCHASSSDKGRCSELLSLPQMSLLLRKKQRLRHTNSSSHSAKQEETQRRDTENVSTAVTQNISAAAEAVCSWLGMCSGLFLPEWHHVGFKI